MKIATIRFHFPWLSVLATAFISVYFYTLVTKDILLSQYIPIYLNDLRVQQAFLICLALTILLDLLIFRRKNKVLRLKLNEYDQLLEEILKTKSQLQKKALKYSDHADKLKMFISERLLEHIEYDEKYLHFKNIASEVRHNGVISYDTVRTALVTAIDNEKKNKSTYTRALLSMQYLWDLLDLSTTDNISLYVANKLYAAEERYYQQILEEDKSKLYSPTFFAYDAVISALPDFIDKTRLKKEKNKSRRNVIQYSDNKIWVELEKSIQLLGNINYIVLLVENLINNALFYLNRRNNANKYYRISVVLKKRKNFAVLSIYNPGSIIDESLKDKIYQLGFSTRRSKDNNGKGLGLYFVHQIVKGNEGEIAFENIKNKKQKLTLEIKSKNGEQITEDIDFFLDNNEQIYCKTPTIEGNIAEYKFKKAIDSIVIHTKNKEETFTFDKLSSNGVIIYDPKHPDLPRWCIEYVKLKTMYKVIFQPLDTTGVKFNVRIPTAESRLEVDYHELEAEEINKLENPDVDFDDENLDLYR